MKLITYKLGLDSEKYFKENEELKEKNLEIVFRNTALSEATPSEAEDSDAEAIAVYVNSKATSKVLEKFKKLKLILVLSTGYDHIDLDYCKNKNIIVSYVPAYGSHAVAEHAFALLLALTKKIPTTNITAREKNKVGLETITGTELFSKTIGIIGTGKIGRNAIKIARGFEMKIIAYDSFEDKTCANELGFTYTTLETLLKESDFISIHVPYLKETHHLLNKNNISLMKQDAYLINTSRGAVIETEALYNTLRESKIAGAGLDVLEEEDASLRNDESLLKDNPKEDEELKLRTVLINNKLIELPNVIITPHNASNTHDSRKRIFETTKENLLSFLEGKPQNTPNA